MSRKKLGKMKGPSHQKGGIPIEVEGGEYVIKKSSVIGNEAALDYLNKTGNLPTDKKEKIMPKVGDKEFAYTEQGMADAKAESAETGIPISDGATRNVTEYAGGGKTGYNAIGNPMYGHGGMTGMDKYKKGGKVMDIPGEQVKFASERKKKEGFKPSKKGKFFSKEKRAERREARKARRNKRKDKTKSFSQKFKEERSKQGAGGTFTWNGKSYTTDRADDKKKAKGKPAKGLGMKPKKAAIKTPKPKDFKKKKNKIETHSSGKIKVISKSDKKKVVKSKGKGTNLKRFLNKFKQTNKLGSGGYQEAAKKQKK